MKIYRQDVFFADLYKKDKNQPEMLVKKNIVVIKIDDYYIPFHNIQSRFDINKIIDGLPVKGRNGEMFDNKYKFSTEPVVLNPYFIKNIRNAFSDKLQQDVTFTEIKYAFLPSNYVSMFSQDEKYEKIESELKVLHSDTKKVEVELFGEEYQFPEKL